MEVSVAICTYNGEDYLQKQIESILDQSRLPQQIIVCDDGSTDSTPEILRSYQSDHPEIFDIYENDANIGVSMNFNKAISKCTGDLIFLADQDDVWKSEKIKHHYKAHQQNNAEIVFNNSKVVDENLNEIATHWSTSPYQYRTVSDPNSAFEELLKYNFLKGCEMSFTSKLKNIATPIPPEVPHDYFIAIIGSTIGKMSDIKTPLQLYRRHSGNESEWRTSYVHKLILSGLEKWTSNDFNWHIQKWEKIYDSVDEIPDSEMVLDKNIVKRQICRRHQFLQDRSEIYDRESPIVEKYKNIYSNILNENYKEYSVSSPFLYIGKDFTRATIGILPIRSSKNQK